MRGISILFWVTLVGALGSPIATTDHGRIWKETVRQEFNDRHDADAVLVQDSLIWFSNQAATFDDAQANCQSMGGNLV